MKGRRLVGSDDHNDDVNEKGTGCSVPVLCVCANLGNEHAADHGNGAFHCWFGSMFEADFHMGMHREGSWPCNFKCFSNVG
jgi:hypothetical protein